MNISQTTEVATPAFANKMTSIETFTSRFNEARNAAASTFLELARVVYQAYETLDKGSFQKFVQEASVGSSSTVKKFLAMGQRYDLLKNHIEKLPSNWTTVYQLSRVEESNLGELLESGSIHPQLKARELKQLVSPDEPAGEVEPPLLQRKPTRLLSITLPEKFDDFEEQEFKQVIDKLKQLGCYISLQT